jgi:outer membrane protein assembly factor BamB
MNAASAFGPARPLVFGSRVFARRQTSAATTLVAIDVENGQTRWQSRLAPFEWVVSDPVVIGNDIGVLVAPREERQTATTLALAAFDSATGELRWRRPLVRLRDSWWTQPTCEVALAGDALFVALGGGVIACDTSGRIKWLRRAPRIPVDVDGWSALQAHDRPMLAEGRLVVAQKGVRLVECLDPETGRRHWTRVFPDLLSVVGIVGSRVVVHAGPAVVGLDLESGKTQWRYESAGGRVLGAQAKEGVVVARRERDRTMLVWLDATSGREMGRSTPEGQDERPLEIGPMLTHSSGRHWALIRRDQASTKSDFCEMVSIGAASPGDTTNQDSVWVRRARR